MSEAKLTSLSYSLKLAFILGLMLIQGCGGSGSSGDGASAGATNTTGTSDSLPDLTTSTSPDIWLAQTHVSRLNNPNQTGSVFEVGDVDMAFAEQTLNLKLNTTGEKLQKLVGGRDTLLKINVASDQGFASPSVSVQLLNADGSVAFTKNITGPTSIPTSFQAGLGQVEHRFEDSYAVVLPGEHIKTGQRMVINATDSQSGASISRTYQLNVGAPTVLPVTMFDFRVLENNGRTLEDSSIAEVGEKLPVKEFNVQRVEILFNEAVFFPITRSGITSPHFRVSKYGDETLPLSDPANADSFYKKAKEFNSSADWRGRNEASVKLSQTMLTALREAGQQTRITSFHGNFNDGTSGLFKGEGNTDLTSSSTNSNVPNAIGVFSHEIAHSVNVHHWNEQPAENYPYRGSMYGVVEPSSGNTTHNGPTWHYRMPTGSAPLGSFASPVYTHSSGELRYRKVISTPGSQSSKPENDITGIFSDFDVRIAQQFLERVLKVYNTDLGQWATWDQSTGGYTKVISNQRPGINFPRSPTPENVYSILVSASRINAGANLIYEIIGPYKSGIVNLYDPTNATSRSNAVANSYCPSEKPPHDQGCDFTLKVVQNGVTSYYMLPVSDASGNLADPSITNIMDEAARHVAINLPVAGGAITSIQLLSTPNAQINAVSGSETVLDSRSIP